MFARLTVSMSPLAATIFAASLLAASSAYGAPAPESTAAGATTVVQSVALADLFPRAELEHLAGTMRADKRIVFHWRIPAGAGPHGALVFIHPHDGGDIPDGWSAILDRRDLAWIAAEKFGNEAPGAQRALVALLGLKQLSRATALDDARRYIGGMSGGGKMAVEVLTRFPAFFDGALCIVGANPVPAARLSSPDLRTKRVVFLTGDRDFNHFDVSRVYEKFRAAGIAGAQLIDLRGFGHQYPDAAQLDDALGRLDPRS